MRGMTEAAYRRKVFDNPAVYRSLNLLRQDNVNWLSLQVAWYQSNDTSNTIFPDPEETPTDASVTRLIRYVHGLGMRVFFDVFVNANHGNAWEAVFHPTDPAKWFASFDRYLVHYGKLAQKDHVDLMAIVDEFDSLDSVPAYAPYWAQAIRNLKRVYHGPVTYGANYSDYQKVTFWKRPDDVGIDAYFPLTTASNPNPGLAALKAAWKRWATRIEDWRIRSGLTSKPFIITGLGYYSGTSTAYYPGAWVPKAPVDLALQKECYLATFQTVYLQPWVKGLFWFWWANPSNPNWLGGPHDNGYTPRGKPAEIMMRNYFGQPRPALMKKFGVT